MKAVALCLLNRTLDKEFPSSVRYVLYQGTTFPQYSVVTNNQLLKRLNGQFIDRASAYEAAQQALDSFNAYVLNGDTAYSKLESRPRILIISIL